MAATTYSLELMRARLSRRTGGLTDSLTNDEVDEYLDYIHKHKLPHKVPGYMHDGEWSFTTVADQEDYHLGTNAVDGGVHSVHGPVKVDGDAVPTYTRLDHWNEDHDPDSTGTGKPNVALVYGTQNADRLTETGSLDGIGFSRPVVRVYPSPDASTYTVSGGGRLFPTITFDGPDGAELLTDWTLVWAILAGAAQEFALDNSEDEMAQREGLRFAECLSSLRSRSLTPAQERPHFWTF